MRIYEINTRVHCQSFDDITASELQSYVELGFDTIWLMGVWQISEGALKVSHLVAEDFYGSPYAVPDYQYNRALGGKRGFRAFAKRAQAAGLAVLVDFVSNHMALDSPWIDQHPEFFIRSDVRVRKQATSDYFLHRSGEMVAFGRDPYFPPWHDTSQLDYTSPGLRARMIEVLREMGQTADGVRCDMAMLILRDYFHQQWDPQAPAAWFNQRWPGEFWDEAIRAVKADRPDFTFIAEAYWEKEKRLVELGFDYAYDKTLYDALVSRNSQAVKASLSRDIAELRRRLYFIENHDEPRAAATFSRPYNLAAAALILSLPGAKLIHEGQMEGKTEKLPVQRLRPLLDEPVDAALQRAYWEILRATDDPIFERGAFRLFETGVYGDVAFMRQDGGRVAAYVGQVADAWHRFHSTVVDISEAARAAGAGSRARVKHLITGETVLVEAKDGKYLLRPNQFSVGETLFCLFEVAPA